MLYLLLLVLNINADVLVTSQLPTSSDAIKKQLTQIPQAIEYRMLHEIMVLEPLTKEKKNHILGLVSKAEEEALKGNFKNAINTYELVLNELELIPAVAGLNKIIFTSYIKLYELYKVLKDFNKSHVFLKKAKAWDYQAQLDPEVFSPDTQRAFLNEKLFVFRKVTLNVPQDSQVFLNGKKIKIDKTALTVDLPDGKHQIAVIQPGADWQTKTFFVHQASEKTITLNTKPIVAGSCSNPQLLNYQLPYFKKLVVFFNQCSRVYDGERWYNIDGEPLASVSNTFSGEQQNLIYSENLEDKPSFIQDLFKSPLFWGAMGAVGIYVFAKSQEQQNIVIPTHTLR